MLDRVKASARYIFHHRTKAVGALGLAAGSAENWLNAHDKLPLWIEHQRGVILMVFGTLVTMVGFYNSLANYFGWRDDP